MRSSYARTPRSCCCCCCCPCCGGLLESLALTREHLQDGVVRGYLWPQHAAQHQGGRGFVAQVDLGVGGGWGVGGWGGGVKAAS